jgi:hypothetical protein
MDTFSVLREVAIGSPRRNDDIPREVIRELGPDGVGQALLAIQRAHAAHRSANETRLRRIARKLCELNAVWRGRAYHNTAPATETDR